MFNQKYDYIKVAFLLFFIQSNLFGDDLTYTITHATSISSNDGAISLNVVGGAADYYYDWEGLSINNQNVNNQNIFNLAPGSYCVTVTDINNCRAGICVEVLNCEIANCLDPLFSYEYGFDGCDLSFTNQSLGNISSYEWDFGDGAYSYEEHPDHTFNQSGSYPVTLTIIDQSGAVNSYQQVVVALCGDDEQGCLISGPLFAAAGQTIQLTGIVPSGASSYLWDVSGPSNVSYGLLNGPGPHNFTFAEYANNNDIFYFDLMVDNAYVCTHTVIIDGSIPDVSVSVFGGHEINGYMYFLANVDWFSITGSANFTFAFSGVNVSDVVFPPESHTTAIDDYDFDGITFPVDGIYEVCVTVQDDVGIYQDCEEFSIGTGQGNEPAPTDFKFITDLDPMTETPIPAPICQNTIIQVTPGEISPNPFTVPTYTAHLYYLNNEGNWIRFGEHLLQDPGLPPTPPYNPLPGNSWTTFNPENYDDISLGVNDCIPIKACLCRTDNVLPCNILTILQNPNDDYDPQDPTNLANHAFSFIYEDPCAFMPVLAPVEIEEGGLTIHNTQSCSPYVRVEASCGQRQEPYQASPLNTGPCLTEDHYYSRYDYKAFDINYPYAELENFLIQDGWAGGVLDTKCVYIDTNHPYFDQFGNAPEVSFRVEAKVTDIGSSTAQAEEVFTIPMPFNISLDQTISRCPDVASLISYEPIVSGGSGNYTYEWGGDNVTDLSDPTSSNPSIIGLDVGDIRTYTLAVTDVDLGCTKTIGPITLTIAQLDLGEWPEYNISCSENSLIQLGIADLETIGGSGNFSFSWSAYYINTDGNEVSYPLTHLSDPYSSAPFVQPADAPSDVDPFIPWITYTLMVVDQEGGCVAENRISIGPGTIDPIANAGDDFDICNGTEVRLGDESNGTGFDNNGTVSWSSNNIYFTETVVSPVLTLSNSLNLYPGTYTYTVTATNETYGCIASDDVDVTVLKPWRYTGFESETRVISEDWVVYAWEDNNNRIFQSSDLSGSDYDAQSGAILPFSSVWEPNSGISLVGVPNNNVPSQASFNTTDDVLFYNLLVTDGSGCTKAFRTDKYVRHRGRPSLSLWTSGPTEDECEADIDMCVNLELRMSYQGDLPQVIYVDTELSGPSTPGVWEAIPLFLVDEEQQVYKGLRCISTEFESDEEAFTFRVRSILEDQPYFPPNPDNPNFPTADYLLGMISFFINETTSVPAECVLCGGDVFADNNVLTAIELTIQGAGHNGNECQPNNSDCDGTAEVTTPTTFIGGEFIDVVGEVLIIAPNPNVGIGETVLYINPCLTEWSELVEDPPSQLTNPSDEFVKKDMLQREDSIKLVIAEIKELEKKNKEKITRQTSHSLSVFPNPFSGQLSIEYYLETKSTATVSLFVRNITSQMESIIIKNRILESGQYFESYSGEKLPPGVYFVELKIDGQSIVEKVIKIDPF